MEFVKCSAPAMIVLLKVCLMLLFLGYASSASGQYTGCPLAGPLSSYFPSVSSVGSPLVTSGVTAKLDSLISSLMAAGSIPFYAVSVVHEDQMVYSSGLPTGLLMVGSITKTSAAFGALMLREKDLLSLSDAVKVFLPNFTVINPYGPHDITLRELMGHVSGLPAELCYVSTSVSGNGLSDECPLDEVDALKSIAQMELIRGPWTEPVHSNLGFAPIGPLLGEGDIPVQVLGRVRRGGYPQATGDE